MPQGLQHLAFGWEFDRCIEQVKWPQSLLSLSFGWTFNRAIQGSFLPESLQTLVFAGMFDQSLEGVAWPKGLLSLTLGFHFNQSLEQVTWPPSLRSLSLGMNFNQSLDQVGGWGQGKVPNTGRRNQVAENDPELHDVQYYEGLYIFKFHNAKMNRIRSFTFLHTCLHLVVVPCLPCLRFTT